MAAGRARMASAQRQTWVSSSGRRNLIIRPKSGVGSSIPMPRKDRAASLPMRPGIDIVATTPDVGEAKESLPVMYKGREFSIAFNPEFLMAPLRNLPNDEVYLDLIDEMSPGVIKIPGPFLYVLMPMRLN